MLRSEQREHIERIITLASAGGQAVAANEIERSWLRCVHDYGMDPAHPEPPRILEAHELREHQDQIEGFLGVARIGMEQLYKRVSSLGYVLLLTDADGVAVDFIGNDAMHNDLKRAGLYLGADWSELRAGTCGVGTCIVEQAAVTCHRTDHFDASHIALTCNSAPLFDPTGGFMGVLDVSSLKAGGPRESQHLALQITAMYAQMIENSNFLSYFGGYWILRLGLAGSLVDIPNDILLAFDADGVVAGMNRNARCTLAPGGDGSACTGQPLTAIFDAALDEILQAVHMPPSAERSTLRTHSGQTYFVNAIAPRVRRPAARAPAELPAPPHEALRVLAGHDPAMQRLIGQAQRLASKPVNIIVHGETGTGKEMLAKAIHVAGPRRERPFVAVNCAAIPETLIESELFGYVAGTFTGARAKGQRGLILQADGGTLFLDEIGDMPIHLQSRLLRVLSECEVVPLGAQRPTPVDLRVVAASHRDLRQLIAQGTFREDLYYRLSGATLHLPALRDREDRDYLLDLIAGQEARELGVTPCFDGAARQALLGYAWPGNVRQLRNMLRFALAMSDDGNLTLETLPPELFEHGAGGGAPAPRGAAEAPPAGEASGEAGPLLALLHRHRWHVPSVAKELGLARATVYRRMEKLGIAPSSRPQ